MREDEADDIETSYRNFEDELDASKIHVLLIIEILQSILSFINWSC